MKIFSKDNIIMALLVVASVLATLFYRERQVAVLKDRFIKTEELLKGINWNSNMRNYLVNLGWKIPAPAKPRIAPIPPDTTEKK